MKKIILATLISGAMSASALAADAGSGTVTFTGSIIEAACSIAPGSRDQTVDLGAVTSASLASNGTSTPASFKIELKDCDMAFIPEGGTDPVKTVTATFTGILSEGDTNKTQLAIVGNASGAGVVITADGSPVKLDGSVATAPAYLQDGQATLFYSAYLQGNSATIVPGSFEALANYTLAYQ